MIKTMRSAVTALAILLAGTMTLTVTSGVAAAKSVSHADHKTHKDGDRKHESHERSHHRKKHRKKVIVCIKAPCPGDRDGDRRRASEDRLKKEKCGTLILPTAGCGTPARDPVGNTRPTLPERTAQPLGDGRKPVVESVK
jgi:Ni/Co efflux regulator RcnB